MIKRFGILIACASILSSVGVASAREDGMMVEITSDQGKKIVDWKYLDPSEITNDWHICVLFPHLKDSYWLAADYGIQDQIKRDKVSMTLYQAGGYNNLSTQLTQLDNCIAQGADGVILGAISADGVGALVRKATSAGIPVIDFVTGINEPSTSAHSSVSYYTMAYLMGKYIVDQAAGKKVRVGYFPGPEGAGWSDAAVKGFNDAIKGSNVELVVTRRGDTGLNVQMDLISNALLTYDNLDWIAGVGIAAEAGSVAVRNAGLAGKVRIAGFNTDPGLHKHIMSGDVEVAPSDFPPLQGRLAVDMVLRLLEKKELLGTRAGPKPELFTKKTAESFPWTDSYPPEGFQPVYNVTQGK